jgi:hypothetical protein
MLFPNFPQQTEQQAEQLLAYCAGGSSEKP